MFEWFIQGMGRLLHWSCCPSWNPSRNCPLCNWRCSCRSCTSLPCAAIWPPDWSYCMLLLDHLSLVLCTLPLVCLVEEPVCLSYFASLVSNLMSRPAFSWSSLSLVCLHPVSCLVVCPVVSFVIVALVA